MNSVTAWNVYMSILTGHQMFVDTRFDRTPPGVVAGWPFGRCLYRIRVKPKAPLDSVKAAGPTSDRYRKLFGDVSW